MPSPVINRRVFDSGGSGVAPGYSFWIRPDGLVTGTSNRFGVVDGANSVSQLADAFGVSGISYDQSTGILQPTLVASVAGTSARKIVRFVGASLQVMTSAAAVSLTNNKSGITMFAVAKTTTGGAVELMFYFSTNTSAANSRCDIRSNSDDTWRAAGRTADADGVGFASGNSSTAAFKIICGVFNFNAGTITIYENGVSIATGNLASSGNTPANNSLVAVLGAGNIGNYFTGDIGDLLFYPNLLSDSQVKNTMSALNAFYGIY